MKVTMKSTATAAVLVAAAASGALSVPAATAAATAAAAAAALRAARSGDLQGGAASFLVSPGGVEPSTLDLDTALAKVSAFATSSSSSSFPQKGVLLRLLPGVYSLKDTLRFDSLASSFSSSSSAGFSVDAPLIIESVDARDPAVLSGGVELTSWAVGPEPWQWVAQLPGNATAANASTLWVNGQRRAVARTDTVQYAASTADNVTLAAGTLPQPLTAAPGLRAVIYHCWTASYHTVSNVSGDGLTAWLGNAQNTAFNGNTQATGKRVYFEGHPAFLAKGSGTFVVDAAANTVTYAPTADELAAHPAGPTTGMNMSVIAPQLVELVRLDNDAAAGVVIRNVNFSYAAADFSACLTGTCDAQSAAFLETAALHFENASGLQLQNVGISHVDGNGVWVGAGSRNVSMDRLHVSDVGAGGVRIGAAIGGVSGDARADHVSLTNSVLEDGGHIYSMGCGVLAQAVSNTTVSHNEIKHFSYTGVSLGWTWNYEPTSNGDNEVSFNHISEIGLGLLSDMGCVYHLGQDFGTKISNNVCHNVSSFDYGGWGYYTDQASRGVLLEKNLGYDLKCAGFHQHYGIENVLDNNVFAFVNNEQTCDAAIRSSAHDSPGDEGNRSNFNFTHNIIYLQEPEDGGLFMATTVNGYRNVSFDNNLYFTAPALAGNYFPCTGPPPSVLLPGDNLDVGDVLQSPKMSASATLQGDGNFCVHDQNSHVAWCSDNISYPATGYTAFVDPNKGQFCVHSTANNTAVFCSPPASQPIASSYFGVLGDDASFCVHKGTPAADLGVEWCGGQKKSAESQTFEALQSLTDCSLASWQKTGHDVHSAINQDPMFVNAAARDFRLQPGSPALALGIASIDTSSVGPQ